MREMLLFALWIVLPPAAAAQSTNLLSNSGFEQQSSGWIFPALVALDTSTFHTGSCSARITSKEFARNYFFNSPRVPVLAGITYRINIWMKLSSLIGKNPSDGIKISMSFYDHSGQLGHLVDITSRLVGTTNWFPYASNIEAPAGASAAQINLVILNAKGSAWFDDLEINGPAPETLPKLEENPSKASAYEEMRILGNSGPNAHPALDDLRVYPNPYAPGSGGRFDSPGVSFKNLPPGAKVRMFTLQGEPVAELQESSGAALWMAVNAQGSAVASGTYWYRISAPNGASRSGRLVVVK